MFNMGGQEKEGVGGKKGCMYSSSCDFLVQLVRYDNFYSYPAFCWLTNTKWLSFRLAQPPGTSLMRSFKKKFGIHAEECL